MRKRKFPLVFKIALFCLAAYGLQRFCYKQTKGFSISAISASREAILPNLVPNAKEEELIEIRSILKQPFRYLNKGVQSFAFLSEDGRYVLKVFRHKRFRIPLIAEWLPLPPPLNQIKTSKIAKKGQKKHKDFSSYALAATELKEPTGVLFAHLENTNCLHTSIRMIDPLGIAHSVDADRLEFVLQKRADMFYPALEKWVQKNDIHSLQRALKSLVRTIRMRCDRQIFDKDPDLNSNFGFIGTESIQIDIGRFRKVEKPYTRQETQEMLIRITDNLSQWLKTKDPELARYLYQEIESAAP